ncbi:MAG: peptidase MA family metallohydrolase [Chloroflexota bacterium]
MRFKPIPILALTLALLVIPAAAAGAQSAISVSKDQATLAFPDAITFSADFESSAEITSVTLEYGTAQQTCGTVVAKAIPQFTPGKQVSAAWTWEMRQSGSQPPGAQVWWRWRVEDSAGNQQLTETQTVTWLDDDHDWQTQTGSGINLHWYGSNQSFGQELHGAAVLAMVTLASETGLTSEQPVDLYIYSNFDDMREAILYEPSWTGGMAFPEYSIVIIGISPENIAWGKTTEAHELTHVLVGHLTFSCIGDVPTWLNEGLAVWGEGGLDPSSQERLDEAIANNTLFPLRSLSGAFSEIADKADLSYSQSYSVVKFLIDTYGKDRMTELLLALRDGETIDDALQTLYGFNIEGLEDAWREGIGAAPRQAAPNPTPTAQPTPVPTIRPISGIPGAADIPSPTPRAEVTAAPNPLEQPPLPEPQTPEFSSNRTLILILTAGCCLVILGLIAALAFIFIRKSQRKEGDL